MKVADGLLMVNKEQCDLFIYDA